MTETKKRNSQIRSAFLNKCISCKFARVHRERYPQLSLCRKWCETVEHFTDGCGKWERTPRPKETTAAHLQYIIDNVCK